MELKNDLSITGTLHSVDQYMNIKLDNVKVVNEDKFPHMVRAAHPACHLLMQLPLPSHHTDCIPYKDADNCCPMQLSVRNCFIRGSVVRYVQLPRTGVDKELLHDATRRQQRGQ